MTCIADLYNTFKFNDIHTYTCIMCIGDLMQSNVIRRCVKLLCKYTTDIKVRIFEEDTALHIAARNNYLEILKLLLSHGLDPELR